MTRRLKISTESSPGLISDETPREEMRREMLRVLDDLLK
jgi:hypothetical protein